MAIIGIDLGTTNSLAAVYRNGRVELIPNSLGEFLTPSVVSIGEDGQVYVGKIAKEMLITRPECTFQEFKRNMGTDHVYLAHGREYRAEELSALVLRSLKEDAERFLREPVNEAVISVPAYFNDDKRCATKNAGALAGFTVERLINEPSAVALKHHMENESMENFLIFDFGGGTLDVSMVEAFDNMVEIRAVSGDNYLGGKDFNELIAEAFYRENGLEKVQFSPEEQGIVLQEAEQLKRMLSRRNQADRTFRLGGTEYTMKMSNQQLIHISAELFKRMTLPMKRVLNDSGMTWDEIDQVILAGGSSKMPVVRQYIQSVAEASVVVDDRPDESIALGVGLAAAIKARMGDIRDMVLSDICPFSLGVELYDGTFSPIIERNDTLPCSRSRIYSTTTDFQEGMEFRIYQGENVMVKDNLLLGTLAIEGLPKMKAGEVSAVATFLYDINGILDIHVERQGQSVHKVILNRNIGLNEEQLKEKLQELNHMAMYPKGKERDRLLIERAQRMYMESTGQVRESLEQEIRWYKSLLSFGKEKEIRQGFVRLLLYLESLEQNQVTFEEFREDFFREENSDFEE
ncbi:MAG: Hsp70 family protein [Firmicutes bacterium]|nr:Hsp70 family protein [Bacillota bacterium]